MSQPKISKVSKIAYCIQLFGNIILVDYDIEIMKVNGGYQVLTADVRVNAVHEAIVAWLLDHSSDETRHQFRHALTTSLREDIKDDLFSLYHNGQITN